MLRIRSVRRLWVTRLEDRCQPAITVGLSGSSVTFLGDSASDSLTLDADASGNLRHSLPIAGNLVSAIDLDGTAAGEQTKLVSALTGLSVDLGGGTNTLQLTGVAANATLTNATFLLVGLAAEADATLTNASIAVSDVPSPYTYTLATLGRVQVQGGSGANVLDASAVTSYPVQLFGLAGNDTLRGTPLPDRLEGGDGNDLVEGLGGNDNDMFYSALGQFAGLFGNSGLDTVRGGDGDDTLFLRSSAGGFADGGPGADWLQAEQVATVTITDTSLTLNGSVSPNHNCEAIYIYNGIVGGNCLLDASAVTLFPVGLVGGNGNDTIRGGAQSDYLDGLGGNDLVDGLGGNDNYLVMPLIGLTGGLSGGAGIDTVRGGDGDDYLADVGPHGAADGGAGNDRLSVTGIASALISDGSLAFGTAASVGNGIEAIHIAGTSGNDNFNAGSFTLGTLWFEGLGGHDTLTGGGKTDRLEGGDGLDQLDGRGGDDLNTLLAFTEEYVNGPFGWTGGLYGGTGADTLRGGDGNDYCEDQGPDGAADGGLGSDLLYAFDMASAVVTDANIAMGASPGVGNGFEGIRIVGNSSNNMLDASALTATGIFLDGGAGLDTLKGGAMPDRLVGGLGNDRLEANGGHDHKNINIPLVEVKGGIIDPDGQNVGFGGDGDDYFEFTGPDNSVDGGAGSDFLYGQGIAKAIITDTTIQIGMTITPNPGVESIRIAGTGGNDTLDASAVTTMPVWLEGGAGNDTLHGGAQGDRLDGGNDQDALYGNGGHDSKLFIPLFSIAGGLYGGFGTDTVDGGNGDDFLNDDGPDAFMFGGDGTDYARLSGANQVTRIGLDGWNFGVGASNDTRLELLELLGQSSAQFYEGGGGTVSPPDLPPGTPSPPPTPTPTPLPRIWEAGVTGDDKLAGGGGGDRIDGGGDNDTLYGGAGDDINSLIPEFGLPGGLYGGPGNDRLFDGPENNYLDGGTGSDDVTIYATYFSDAIVVSGNTVTIDGKTNTIVNCETLTIFAGSGTDTGIQMGAVDIPNFIVNGLEPTVAAGVDSKFVNNLVRTGTFTDIGAGQTWTGSVDYGDGGGFQTLAVNQTSKSYDLNHTYSKDDSYLVRVRVTDNQGNTGEDAFLWGSALIRPNGGAIQRSQVMALDVLFAEPVTLNTGWYTFERLTPGPLPTVSVASTPTSAQLTFSGAGVEANGSLADGRYRLTILAANVLDGAGQPLDGDNDGTPGGNMSHTFHRLFGDADGNATVDGADFAAFGGAFGVTGASIFDFDDNATVDGADFGQFGNRFGVTL